MTNETRLHALDVYDWWSPMATNDAGSGSSHRCQAMSGSSTALTIPARPTPRYELREWSSMEHGLRSRDMETGSIWIFSTACFPLLLFFSWLDLGPVQMASARVFTTCHWRWSFPVRGFAERSPWAVQIRCGTYGFVRWRTWNGCLIASFLFLSFPTLVRGYAAQEVCT